MSILYKKETAFKQKVIELSNELGYKLETNHSAIYLVKNSKRMFKRSYAKAYHYLYDRNRDSK